MGYDIVSGLKFSFGALRDRQVMIWTAFFAAVLYSAAIVSTVITLLIPGLIAADWLIFGMPISTLASAVFIFLLGLGLTFAYIFFQYQFCRHGVRIAGYEAKGNFPQFFLVSIKTFFLNLFIWYDKRFLAVVLVLYAITALWMAAGTYVHPLMVSVGFGVLAFAVLVHYIGVFAHSLRTVFAPLIYLREGSQGPTAPKRAYNLIDGQTMEFAVPAVSGIIVFGMLFVPAAVLIVALGIGLMFIAAINSAATLYLVNMFRFFEQKGQIDKQKANAGKD